MSPTVTQTEQDRVAARRLALKQPSNWTVNEASEARNCVGCRATYKQGVRVVKMLPHCPAHDPRLSHGGSE